MAETTEQPIIIKRIKKGGHGHHGGAWKVAYADFVTAMMAFFLLLWLLNVTSPEQKMGLAEYFTPTIGIKDAMGIGFKGGKSPSTEIGRSRQDMSAPGLVVGQVRQGPLAQAPSPTPVKDDPDAESTSTGSKSAEEGEQSPEGKEASQDNDEFKIATDEIKQALESDPEIKDYKNSIVVQNTPDGMKIDMIDDQKKPMFIPGSANLTDMGKKVLDSMANIIAKTPNTIVLTGHTDAASATSNPQYTNWELSSDRANAARRFLVTTQLEQERVTKVVGMADRELLSPQEPTSPRNRRITVILVRGSYFRDPKATPTTRTLLSVPDAKVKKPEPKEEPKPESQEPPKPTGMFDPTIKPEGR